MHEKLPRIDKTVISVAQLRDAGDEKAYWRSRTAGERLNAIEQQRRMVYGEIELHPDFKDFLKLLNSRGVEYLVVGGYAVGYYGYPRAHRRH